MARVPIEDTVDLHLALILEVYLGTLNMLCPLLMYLINTSVVIPKDLLPYYDEFTRDPNADRTGYDTLMPWVIREALQQIVNGDNVRDPQWLRAVIDGGKSGRAGDSGRDGESNDDE